jgi:hypothetical protein
MKSLTFHLLMVTLNRTTAGGKKIQRTTSSVDGPVFMKAAEKKKLLFEIRAKDVLQMFLHPDSTVHDLFFLLRATKDHQYLADFSAKKILELERLCRKRRCNNMEKRMRSAKLASSQMDPRAIRTLLWLRHR